MFTAKRTNDASHQRTLEALFTLVISSNSKFGPVNDLPSYCIGYLGADWWGSDARALSCQLRSGGHLVIERHYEDYLSTKWRSKPLKLVRRILRNRISAEYNSSVEELLAIDAMDFLLVFKGMLLSSTTLRKFRDAGKACYCLYPDVSFKDHGRNIWDCLPLYDCIFTTKSFHMSDPALQLRINDLKLVPHGCDPEVHRPVRLNAKLGAYYGCDVAFVGVWSPKKETMISEVIRAVPKAKVKIWGPYWNRSSEVVQRYWQQRAAYGDELAAICAASKINLGLLSEAGSGTRIGDQTTARTWQIPACGGFMLHEDTSELRSAFVPGEHLDVFSNATQLGAKVQQYLNDDKLRERIRIAGHSHCHERVYSYKTAADCILAHHAGTYSR